MNRRDLIIASGLSLLVRTPAFARKQQPQAPKSPSDRLLDALRANRLPLSMSNGPSGAGWDLLVQQARDARFTLVGEEHGVAETAQLSAALFNAIRSAGYDRMAIELSPPIAQGIEAAARRNGNAAVIWKAAHASSSLS